MRVIVLLFLLSGVCSFTAYGQGVDVRGVVADSATGERIPFANVILRGTTKGTTTNINGFYLITNVPRGKYEIVASAVGYGREVKALTVFGDDVISLNFRLPPQTVEFSEIVVESERPIERYDASGIRVLSSDQIRQIPSAGQADVLRSLLVLPGIVSTSDVSSKFYVRGGAGDQNLILLDGVKMYTPFHAFGIFSVFDPDIVNTTEVFTGAYPAGFGNRLSSVVKMTTRQGNSNRISAKGEANLLHGKLLLEGPIPDGNSWLINGRTSLSDGPFQHFLHTRIPMSFYDVFVKATLGNETGRNSFHAFFSGDNVTSDRPDEPDYSWRTHALAASFSGLASDRVYVDGVVYTSVFDVQRNAKQSPTALPAESSVGDDGLHVDITFHTEHSGSVLTGLQVDLPQYTFTRTTSTGITQTFDTINSEVWMWGRHQYQFGPFQTDAGVHIDVVSLFEGGPTIQTFQPRLSIGYALSELWKTRFSFGVYNQRAVTISNEDDITSLFDAWIAIPDNLQPEEARHYVLGVEGLLSSQLSMSVQTYYKDYPSLVLYNRYKYFPSDPDYVSGTGKAYGTELLTRFGSPLFDLYLAYSLGWTRVTTGGLTYSPRYDRRHTVNALGVIHPISNLDISVRWEFGSGYPFTQTVGYYDRLLIGSIGGGPFASETGDPYSILGEKNAARLPAYYRIDASITYHFSLPPVRGSIALSAANLTNRRNILFYDRKSGQQINMLDFFPSATLRMEY